MEPNKMSTEKTGNSATSTDPFDLSRLRLPQDFTADLGVKKALVTVPVRKPDRQAFFRVHPDPAYRIELGVIESREDREVYLVGPDLRSELANEITPKVFYVTITRQGVLALWGVRLPGPDGKLDAWNSSAHEAAQIAMIKWVRISANMGLGAYDVFEATSQNIPGPEWPPVPLETLLRTAFKDKFIATVDHPFVKSLRGEL
jgi:hypothetical protein